MSEPALYDDIAGSYHQWVSQGGDTLVDETFSDLVGSVVGQRICAVGCGAGRETRFLAHQGAIVTGVDFSVGLLEIARAEESADPLGITYLHGNAHDLADIEDSAFDGAVCYMALMDIPDLSLALVLLDR